MPVTVRSRAFPFACVALAALTACSDASNGAAPLASLASTAEAAVLGDPDDPRWPSDPLTVEAARIVGDSLVATVAHGGGCRDHEYRLVISTTWMESFPVQVPARISHNANGDVCKALLRREVRVSLAPLAQAYRDAYKQTNGSISLRLAGSPSGLLYTF